VTNFQIFKEYSLTWKKVEVGGLGGQAGRQAGSKVNLKEGSFNR